MKVIMTMIQGFCMSLADSVPGVSGGTIAFIMGFYDQFIGSLDAMVSGNKEQKKKAADQVAAALVEAIGCNPDHISVAVEDFTPVEWQDEFRKEVTESSHIYKEPNYDPKDVL